MITAYKLVVPAPKGDGTYQSLLGTMNITRSLRDPWVLRYSLHERTEALPGTLGLYAFSTQKDISVFAQWKRNGSAVCVQGCGTLVPHSVLACYAAPTWNLSRFYKHLEESGGAQVVAAWPLRRWIEWITEEIVFYSPIGTVLLQDFTPEEVIA